MRQLIRIGVMIDPPIKRKRVNMTLDHDEISHVAVCDELAAEKARIADLEHQLADEKKKNQWEDGYFDGTEPAIITDMRSKSASEIFNVMELDGVGEVERIARWVRATLKRLATTICERDEARAECAAMREEKDASNG